MFLIPNRSEHSQRIFIFHPQYVKKFAEKIWLIHNANDLLTERKQRSTRKDFHAVAENHNFRTQPRVAKKYSLLAIGLREINEAYHMELLDARWGKWRTLPRIKNPSKDKHLFRMNCAYALYTDVENTENIMIIGGANCRDLKKVNL